jgi:hypothetical protein
MPIFCDGDGTQRNGTRKQVAIAAHAYMSNMRKHSVELSAWRMIGSGVGVILTYLINSFAEDRVFAPRWRVFSLASFLVCMSIVTAHAEQMLQVLEPGMGYSRFKQWAIENNLVFENFTKDSLVVRDTGLQVWESIRIQARFCAGDDYSGKASSLVIQQIFKPEIDAVVTQRDYVEFLAGKKRR